MEKTSTIKCSSAHKAAEVCGALLGCMSSWRHEHRFTVTRVEDPLMYLVEVDLAALGCLRKYLARKAEKTGTKS